LHSRNSIAYRIVVFENKNVFMSSILAIATYSKSQPARGLKEMDLFLEVLATSTKAFPITLLVGGLAAWLGKVWSVRIAANEKYLLDLALESEKLKLNKDLEDIRSTVDLQKVLISHLHQAANFDMASITKEQIEAVKLFWNFWHDFRNEVGKFQTPHRILPVQELRDSTIVKTIFPYSEKEVESSIKRALECYSQIERLRPFVPLQVYQHFLGVGTFYVRLGVRFMTELAGNKVSPWYGDLNGKFDYSVDALMSYGNSVGMDLPHPVSGGDSYLVFAKWLELLEEKLNELVYQFVNGSLSRQFEVHSAIKEIANIGPKGKIGPDEVA